MVRVEEARAHPAANSSTRCFSPPPSSAKTLELKPYLTAVASTNSFARMCASLCPPERRLCVRCNASRGGSGGKGGVTDVNVEERSGGYSLRRHCCRRSKLGECRRGVSEFLKREARAIVAEMTALRGGQNLLLQRAAGGPSTAQNVASKITETV